MHRWMACSILLTAAVAVAGVVVATPPGPSLGAHVFLGEGEGLGSSPAVTAPVETRPAGSILLAFNAGYSGNIGAPSDTYGNRWKPLGAPQSYAGYDDRFGVQAYTALGARGGPGYRLSVTKPAEPAGELSFAFVEVTGASRIASMARSYADPAPLVTSDTVTTTGPATLLAFWWGDGGVKRMSATPLDGFQLIDAFVHLPDESGVQGAVAWRQVTAAGTYRVRWSVEPTQGAALWLIAVE